MTERCCGTCRLWKKTKETIVGGFGECQWPLLNLPTVMIGRGFTYFDTWSGDNTTCPKWEKRDD